jgi:hypothetical protein
MTKTSIEKEFATFIYALKMNELVLNSIPPEVKANKDFISLLLSETFPNNSTLFEKIDWSIIDDYDSICKLANKKSFSKIFQYLSPQSRDNPLICIQFLRSNNLLIKHVSNRLKNDKEFIYNIFTPETYIHDLVFTQFSSTLYSDKEFINFCVKRNPLLLIHCPDFIKNDKDILQTIKEFYIHVDLYKPFMAYERNFYFKHMDILEKYEEEEKLKHLITSNLHKKQFKF